MQEQQRILLIEDDAVITSGLVYALEKEGFFVVHAGDVKTALGAVSKEFDLAIVDIGLPDGTGFDLVGKLREAGASMLFLTAVDEERDIVRAFEGGAEDYVTKPFRLGELMARVKAVLRRRIGGVEVLTLNGIVVNVGEGRVYKKKGSGRENGVASAEAGLVAIELTALEYRLLVVFAHHKNQVLTRGQILNLLWDSVGIFVEDNTLTVYVKRLREKLGDGLCIETVRGVGYRCVG